MSKSYDQLRLSKMSKQAGELLPSNKDFYEEEKKERANNRLNGDYWGFNTVFAEQNEDFPSYWRQWDRYPSYDDKLIRFDDSYNWMRPFLFPFYFVMIPYSFIGGCIEFIWVGIGSLVDEKGENRYEKLLNSYEVTDSPFGVLGAGIAALFEMPIEIIKNVTLVCWYIIGNFFIHLGYFDWFFL
jgi:hypothetical protein